MLQSGAEAYYTTHLDDKNHVNIMNCTYYIVFEQIYRRYQWWIDKKARIDQTINNFKSKDPALKAAAVAQTKVSIFILAFCHLTANACSENFPVRLEIFAVCCETFPEKAVAMRKYEILRVRVSSKASLGKVVIDRQPFLRP